MKHVEWPTREMTVQEALLHSQVVAGNMVAAVQLLQMRSDDALDQATILVLPVSEFWTAYNKMIEAIKVVGPAVIEELGPFKQAFRGE